MYETILQPSGLTTTQLELLRTLVQKGSRSITDLSEQLDLDRTSLRRMLDPMERDGLLKVKAGSDRRVRNVDITAKGRKAADGAQACWEKAQETLFDVLGEEQWVEMTSVMRRATKLVKQRLGELQSGQ